MEEAGKHYNEGDYQAALEIYQTVLDNGYESAELYYNLGNTYFKLKQIPKAILYYEKARKLAPHDDDIEYNLRIANTLITDKIEPLPRFFLYTWWDKLVIALSVDQWALVGVVAYFLLLLMVVVLLFSRQIWLKKLSFSFSILFLLVFLLSVILANQQYKYFLHRTEAIVFTPTVMVKSSPRENSTDIFVIHEGTKVTITNQVGEWYEIKIADGNKGWIKESDIEKI